MKKLLVLTLLLTGIFIFAACGGRSVKNVDVSDTVVDQTWSANDNKKASESFIQQITATGEFMKSSKYVKEKPRWILAEELDQSLTEHIDTRLLLEKIRTYLINKQLARFIDDQALKKVLEQLEMQQSDLYDNDKAAKVGKLVGAKLLLRGKITSIEKKDGLSGINYYSIILTVVNIETAEILWTGEYEFARKGTKSRFR